MIMRESKRGEKITTLDEKEIILPGGDIVVEDGDGQLIDLCGIMGGLNSAVTDKTERVVLFIQTYNKQLIRKTAMITGARTVAATYFEKGTDEERVEPTLVYGLELLEKYAGAKIGSPLYDIYPNPYQPKRFKVQSSKFKELIGIEIEKKTIINILKKLGFAVKEENELLNVIVPSHRKDDVSIPEDLVEEVARVYGYHNLPNTLQPATYITQPKEIEQQFDFQNKIKIFLKHLGLNEVANYSMISRKMIENFGLKTADHLHLSNSISKEIEFMRTTLLPSLYKNIKDNLGKKEILKFFETAKVYFPQKNDLPKEVYKLGIAVNSDFFDLKGIVESLYRELNIDGDVFQKIIAKDNTFLVEIDLAWLIANAKTIASYQPINPYAVVKLDLTVVASKRLNFAAIKKIAFTTSKLLQKIDVVDTFNNKITLRSYFTSNKRNITEKEAKEELEKVRVLLLR
jgi:phenylalanyl-tRNA synthetase beta chain